MKRLLLLSILLSGIIANAQTSLTVNVTNPGTLGVDFHATGGIDTLVTNLKINGKINTSDFTFMRDNITKLSFIDLSDITIDGMQIPPYAFADKLTLTDVVWPRTYFSIGSYAFKNSGLLINLKLPNSVTRIENNAFADCKNLNYNNKLEENTYLTIPSSVTYIGDKAFPTFTFVTIAQPVPFSIYSSFYSFKVQIPYGSINIYKSLWKNQIWQLNYVESFYVVSFNLEIAEHPYLQTPAIDDILLEHPAKINPPQDPVMSGSTFGGWYTNSTFTNKWNPDDTIKSNLTIYAKWIPLSAITALTVNVTKPGTLSEAITAARVIDSSITNLKVSGKINACDFKFMRDNLINLNAIDLSEVIIYPYDGFGGTRDVYDPLPPSELHYRWFQIPPYAFADKRTLKKIVLPSTYITIGHRAFQNCELAGDLNIPSSVTSIDYGTFSGCTNLFRDDKYTLTIPSLTTFLGDYLFPLVTYVKIAKVIPIPISSHTFEMIFTVYVPYGSKSAYMSLDYWKNFNIEESFYVVSFNLEKEEHPYLQAPAIDDILLECPAKINPPQDPVMSGSTFAGWYTDSTFTNKWNPDDTIKSNLTIYAKWNLIPHKVHYETNGGSAIPDTLMVPYRARLDPPTPTRIGYDFMGWYTENSLDYTKGWYYRYVTSDTTLYAGWSMKYYSVRFLDPDGHTNTNSVYFTYFSTSKKIARPQNPVIWYGGYTFEGWYKDSIRTILWDFDNDTVSANISLYAKWDTISYKVSFNTNGGNTIADTSIKNGTLVIAPQMPIKKGYSFIDWYSDTSLTNIWGFISVLIFSDTTLYAKWSINSYLVTFDTQGGNAIGDTLVNYSTKVGAPEVPGRVGYLFGGWYKDYTFLNEWNFNKDSVVSNLTLYAQWIQNNCGINKDLFDLNFLVYPNPSDGLIYFDFGTLNITKINIINCFGELIFNSTTRFSSINLDYLDKGAYFLLIYTKKTCIHKKIIIQ